MSKLSAYSKAQEYRLRDRLKALGIAEAARVPLSGGCHAIGAGDVVTERFLFDHKSTRGKDSITVKRADLEKIAIQAARKLGILTLSFLGCRQVYAVVPLERLMEALNG